MDAGYGWLIFALPPAGYGWLIFALPPAEGACHPGEEDDQHQSYLMCHDLKMTMAALDSKGIRWFRNHRRAC